MKSKVFQNLSQSTAEFQQLWREFCRLSKNRWKQVFRRGPHSNMKVVFHSNVNLASNSKCGPDSRLMVKVNLRSVQRSHLKCGAQSSLRSSSKAELSQSCIPIQMRISNKPVFQFKHVAQPKSLSNSNNSNTDLSQLCVSNASLRASRFYNRTEPIRITFLL